eukprot:TRINITY_DN8939_c0_g1_i1.p1 TRINITY_DN8939_c0_g1~~TRINITY_DN8939_c0_g1_i1.p1  ORF type:complete len:104 (+),score=9.34 TRINITY_DN8939_c0_g1_i1:37-312(+)
MSASQNIPKSVLHPIEFEHKGVLESSDLYKPLHKGDAHMESRTPEELQAELTNHRLGGPGEMDRTLHSTEKKHPELDLEADDGDAGGETDY